MTTRTKTLKVPGGTITYDVHGPLPTTGRPPLLMIGQPMGAAGFATLASHFPERTVVTYDPRGLGRSIRDDGRTDNNPDVQAEDLHALIAALGAGPIELFASSGGAVTGLALVAAHPEDVRTLVAHEPPLLSVLPDAERALAAEQAVQQTYLSKGPSAGWAHFMAMSMWRGEFTDEYAAQPAPDRASFGIASRRRRLPGRPDAVRGFQRRDPLRAGHQSPQVGIHADRYGGRDRVRRHDHRAHVGGRRGGAGPAPDDLSQQPRWLPGRRVRPNRRTRGLRRQAPRRARHPLSP